MRRPYIGFWELGCISLYEVAGRYRLLCGGLFISVYELAFIGVYAVAFYRLLCGGCVYQLL